MGAAGPPSANVGAVRAGRGRLLLFDRKRASRPAARTRSGEWPGGVSPPGSLRTRREPLGSPGSHRPAVGAHTKSPVGEQSGLASEDVDQEPACLGGVAAQPLVLALGPTHEIRVDAPEDLDQHRAVEAPVVVDPALDDRIEDPRQVGEGLVRTQMQAPAADLPPHPLARDFADRREEVDELAASLAPRQPRAEPVPEEVERLVLIRAAPIGVLAVHDAGLALVEREPAVRQPGSDRVPQQPGLAFARGVDNHVVAIALE